MLPAFIGVCGNILEVVDPIAVTAALLRAQLPEVPLRKGASMMARVASRGESHAVIVIAGIPVTAQVPPEVQAGRDAQAQGHRRHAGARDAADRSADAAGRLAAGAGAHGTAAAAGRGGAPARRRGADGEPADVVALTFTSPTLGKLDLRLELRGERLLAEVTTPAGRPHVVATGASERLRANLEAVGLEATVKVRPRHTPLDLYA